PLRPALYHLLARRETFGRVCLLYGTRTPEDILYIEQLRNWGGRADLQILVTVDCARKDWSGNVGAVTALIARTRYAPTNTMDMVCGPEIMMRFAIRELQTRGIPNDRIYISMERNMKCAVGFCGHCQFGPTFICKDGPVFRYDTIQHLLAIREL